MNPLSWADRCKRLIGIGWSATVHIRCTRHTIGYNELWQWWHAACCNRFTRWVMTFQVVSEVHTFGTFWCWWVYWLCIRHHASILCFCKTRVWRFMEGNVTFTWTFTTGFLVTSFAWIASEMSQTNFPVTWRMHPKRILSCQYVTACAITSTFELESAGQNKCHVTAVSQSQADQPVSSADSVYP